MKNFLITTIIALLLSGCSWVQSMRGIPPPTPKVKPKTTETTPRREAVTVIPGQSAQKQDYMEQRKREVFSLNPPKHKRRAIEGENEVERAALKEAYDDMDTNLEKNRNKVFSF